MLKRDTAWKVSVGVNYDAFTRYSKTEYIVRAESMTMAILVALAYVKEELLTAYAIKQENLPEVHATAVKRAPDVIWEEN